MINHNYHIIRLIQSTHKLPTYTSYRQLVQTCINYEKHAKQADLSFIYVL